MTRQSRSTPRPAPGLLPLVGALCALFASGAAQAQLYPYFVQVSQTLGYDSNLFRVSDSDPEGEESDTYSLTAVTVGFDQPLGRQRLRAYASGNYTKWIDNDQLDSFGYDLGADLRWEIGSKWSGNARLAFTQRQADFSTYGALTGDELDKNLERAQVLDLRAQYGGASLLAIEGLANYTDVSYSENTFATRELQTEMVGIGLRYNPGGAWSAGLYARYTDGEYGAASGLPRDTFERNDIDLTATYQVSGLSTVGLRLSYTDEDHSEDSGRNFSGGTGEVRWDYQPTGKLFFSVAASRETGAGSTANYTVFSLAPAAGGSPTTPGGGTPGGPSTGTPTPGGSATPPNVIATSGFLSDAERRNRINLGVRYDATGKVQVFAFYDHARERYDNRFVTGDDPDSESAASGTSRKLGIAARYAATRVWSFECGLGREERDTDAEFGGGALYRYDANTAFCSARLSLQ